MGDKDKNKDQDKDQDKDVDYYIGGGRAHSTIELARAADAAEKEAMGDNPCQSDESMDSSDGDSSDGKK